jgi:hypothetical protein
MANVVAASAVGLNYRIIVAVMMPVLSRPVEDATCIAVLLCPVVCLTALHCDSIFCSTGDGI